MAKEGALGFSRTVLRKKFRTGMTVRAYREKEVVFSQGETADAVFYIQSGTVKLTAVSTRRKKAIIALLQRGSLLGEGCLAGRMAVKKAPARTLVVPSWRASHGSRYTVPGLACLARRY